MKLEKYLRFHPIDLTLLILPILVFYIIDAANLFLKVKNRIFWDIALAVAFTIWSLFIIYIRTQMENEKEKKK